MDCLFFINIVEFMYQYTTYFVEYVLMKPLPGFK